MKICLIASEIFGMGRAGGFGFAIRSLGRELVRMGLSVTAVVPRAPGIEEEDAVLDGIRVHTYAALDLRRAVDLLRAANADLYHSQEPSIPSWLARRAAPDRRHLVTSRDPRCFDDWLVEFRHPTRSRGRLCRTCAWYENPLTYHAVRRADRVFVPAHFLRAKVKRKYRLPTLPAFLPTPVRLPDRVEKADRPTVCYVGRLDRRKRPDRFLALAERRPDVSFVVMGDGQDPAYMDGLRRKYGDRGNIEWCGFVNQFEDARFTEVLSRSWAIVNTSAREGLPNSLIEACAHGCAVLSEVDPDGFATRFGIRVRDGRFEAGLQALLADGRWKRGGDRGRAYVQATNSASEAARRHVDIYEDLV